ncbi:Putative N(4)-(beta-N-acetylglucosaminyl)-L-asparaginase [Cladobotryum mycophilum]|uniref:N(4)-(Beta-N-acetylglucosaminyl)-L-asparaginase n=1 Tax=Cladobotryum mycophilum TaxID=491253 RepID=A0ABR0SWU6_9HYPO
MVNVSLVAVLAFASTALCAPQPRACVGPAVNGATLNLIKQYEGFVPSPKPDPVGYPTVGYGHKCQNKGCSEVPFKFPLTQDTATQLLARDVVGFQQCITLATADPVRLNANQYGALVSWSFNVGCGAAKTSSLIKRLNGGQDPNTVLSQELPLWNKGGGKVLPGLVKRRAAEVALAKTATSVGALPVNQHLGSPFTAATDAAYLALSSSSSATSALDAVEIGCATCEANQCDGTVGYGGSPDESCETTLDAMIMDGSSMKSGAVANLRRVRDAIAVARHVLEYTEHTLLAGDQATQFALQNGFPSSDLSTPSSMQKCEAWRANDCQPNYRLNVHPNPLSSCGPYTPIIPLSSVKERDPAAHQASHDTLSLIAIHADGSMAAGTTTNGASYKIPGRVGDGPITGSGSYVDGDVGGCGATGDGDIMMRFVPCYQAVESMRRGLSP